jgi:pseudouridine-5'-phosphate glycosidase
MPYPKNLQTAMEVEAVVRENGAVPATIAILNGVPHVGESCDFSCDSEITYMLNCSSAGGVIRSC